jgi:hypothetical protein
MQKIKYVTDDWSRKTLRVANGSYISDAIRDSLPFFMWP